MGMSVGALAENITSESNTPQEVEATLSVDESWTVTIPADFKINENPNQTVSVEGILSNAQTLNVKVTSTDWKLDDKQGHELKYNVKKNGSVLSNDIALTFEAGTTSAEAELTFALDDDQTPTVAGDYSDTITFTVEVN